MAHTKVEGCQWRTDILYILKRQNMTLTTYTAVLTYNHDDLVLYLKTDWSLSVSLLCWAFSMNKTLLLLQVRQRG